MLKLKRNCEICEKELIITPERIGRSSNHGLTGHDKRFKTFRTSNEGTFFHNKWFCNDCWAEILNKK
jgi:hypothetical protein